MAVPFEPRRRGPQSVDELLAEHLRRAPAQAGVRLRFVGVEDRDVYNITAPFEADGELVIAGRVESRSSEYSDVYFFTRRPGGEWAPKPGAPRFTHLQDPFVTRIGGELIFGGVEIWPHPLDRGRIEYRTVFYRGSGLGDLRMFAAGPQHMKDIRLVETADGRIGVFTRPKGPIGGGEGTIGFTLIDRLEDLRPSVILGAELIEGQFLPQEWGGVNEVHRLSNGLLGVLGHIARKRGKTKHYYAMVFAYDVESRQASPMRIVAARSDFPAGEAKRADLEDVVFSGGLRRLPGGRAELYTGVSDAEAHMLVIDDPFLEFEEKGLIG